MAHRAHLSANRFAQSSTHPTDYPILDSDSQDNHYQASPNVDFHSDNSDNGDSHSYDHTSTPITTEAQAPLRMHVERVVREYFAALGDEVPTDLYELILKEVELPLLTVVLEQTRGNQTKCAQILGLNRGTLRKKMKIYHLM